VVVVCGVERDGLHIPSATQIIDIIRNGSQFSMREPGQLWGLQTQKSLRITYTTSIMAHNTLSYLTEFLTEPRRQDLSPNTVESYRSDLLLFARGLTATTSDGFSATTVTPTDVREY
jgi:hypothetical protein